ncbi:MAG: lysophospholipid acyltransferase family protein [Bryobacterales bacterium]|nr:lysophospholipid acyltransferase family protein [Bryobacterales bacterium]
MARSIIFVLARLPSAISYRLARWIAHLLRLFVPRLSQVALRNLKLTKPELGELDRSRIVRGVFDSVARLLWVMANTVSSTQDNEAKRKHKLDKVFTMEGLEIVDEAFSKGHGILFATGHLGAWELSALGFGAKVRPMDIIARPLDNPLLDRWITALRESSGNRVLAKSGTVREVLRALGENRAVGFLVDHNVISSDLCFIRFLGVEAAASTVFAKLAARTGAVVIPGFCLWEETRKQFVLRFYPPVPISGNTIEDTQRIHSCLEEVLLAYPEQWLWVHRRFKTRPGGEADLYSNLQGA